MVSLLQCTKLKTLPRLHWTSRTPFKPNLRARTRKPRLEPSFRTLRTPHPLISILTGENLGNADLIVEMKLTQNIVTETTHTAKISAGLGGNLALALATESNRSSQRGAPEQSPPPIQTLPLFAIKWGRLGLVEWRSAVSWPFDVLFFFARRGERGEELETDGWSGVWRDVGNGEGRHRQRNRDLEKPLASWCLERDSWRCR